MHFWLFSINFGYKRDANFWNYNIRLNHKKVQPTFVFYPETWQKYPTTHHHQMSIDNTNTQDLENLIEFSFLSNDSNNDKE